MSHIERVRTITSFCTFFIQVELSSSLLARLSVFRRRLTRAKRHTSELIVARKINFLAARLASRVWTTQETSLRVLRDLSCESV